jgi:hypothetical protein
MIPVNEDLTQDALELLPNQFYDKEGVRALLSAYTNSLQSSNDTAFDILDQINVDDATGYLLDCVGSYLAVVRQGELDEPYRDRIRSKILSASSEGTPNNLLESLASTTGGTTNIWEHFPVSVTLSTTGTIIPVGLAMLLQDASPVTSGDVVVYINPSESSFVPSDLAFDVPHLGDSNRSHFVTDVTDEHIVVNDLIFGAEGDTLALLSEFTYGQGEEASPPDPDGLGILCEIAKTIGGVDSYNHEYILLDDAINGWYVTMNYLVPEDFE